MQTMKDLIAEHPFFRGLDPEHLDVIAGCAQNVRFQAGEFLFREGDEADRFFLIRHGRVALSTYIPERGAITIQTIGAGEVLGWSWLFPPYRWHFDARALEVTRAIAFDGKCLREKCQADPKLGYELMRRFASIMVDRLQATRLQLLDVYGGRS